MFDLRKELQVRQARPKHQEHPDKQPLFPTALEAPLCCAPDIALNNPLSYLESFPASKKPTLVRLGDCHLER